MLDFLVEGHICVKDWHLGYDEMLDRLQIPRLDARRKAETMPIVPTH